MEKIYQIKIWKIIQIIFYNLLVSFIPFVIIGEFLLQIPQIFPVTFLVIIFYYFFGLDFTLLNFIIFQMSLSCFIKHNLAPHVPLFGFIIA